MYIGVGVGWQRRCKTCQSLRVLENQDGTVFFFFRLAVTMMVIELDHIARGEEPYFRTGGMIASRSGNMERHQRGSCIVIPIAASGVATPEDKVIHWRCHP